MERSTFVINPDGKIATIEVRSLFAFVFAAAVRVVVEIANADGPERGWLAANFGWATLTGFFWYGQFFFYEIAHTYMGAFEFTSWALHMAMLVVFSVLLGVFLKEWKGCRRRTVLTLAGAVAALLGAVASITYGSYLGGG